MKKALIISSTEALLVLILQLGTNCSLRKTLTMKTNFVEDSKQASHGSQPFHLLCKAGYSSVMNAIPPFSFSSSFNLPIWATNQSRIKLAFQRNIVRTVLVCGRSSCEKVEHPWNDYNNDFALCTGAFSLRFANRFIPAEGKKCRHSGGKSTHL